MSDYHQFLASESSKFLAALLQGLAAAGKTVDTDECAIAALASAKALYVLLENEGAV